jgi:GTP-binding protein
VSSASARDPVADFDVIERELTLFQGRPDEPSDMRAHFSEKPRLAAANKIDALDDPSRLSRLAAHLEQRGVRLYPISAATGEGVPALVEAIWREVSAGVAPRPDSGHAVRS